MYAVLDLNPNYLHGIPEASQVGSIQVFLWKPIATCDFPEWGGGGGGGGGGPEPMSPHPDKYIIHVLVNLTNALCIYLIIGKKHQSLVTTAPPPPTGIVRL